VAYGRRIYHRSFFIKFLYACIRRRVPSYLIYVISVESLVYSRGTGAEELTKNINAKLEEVGWINIGVNERKNLVVLNRTEMPAVLLEIGFINTDRDNELFEKKFMETAEAIAEGVLETLQNA